MFSSNVSQGEGRRIASLLGVSMEKSLGTSLGVPLSGCRTSKVEYKYLLDKINNKLNGLSAKMLSLLGRLTLIKSVLSSIPYYTIQTMKLPQAICSKIEESIQRFLWGGGGNDRRVHLVNWGEVCRPLYEGGLRVKRP